MVLFFLFLSHRYKAINPRSLGKLTIATELLEMIFTELTDFNDTMCLAICHPRLLEIGDKFLRSKYSVLRAPWTQKRIIIVGEDTETSDLPKPLRKELSKRPEYRRAVESDDFAHNCYDKKFDIWRFKRTLFRLKKRVEAVGDAGDVGDQLRMDAFLARAYTPSEKTDHWVLLNFDAKQYVRREYLAQKNAPDEQEREGGLKCRGKYGLGNALTYSITFCYDIQRMWAGHRFMVTTTRYLQTLIDKGEEWKDASETVFRGMKEFYRD